MSWCHVFRAGTPEPLQCSQWMTLTLVLALTGTEYNQPLVSWQCRADGAVLRVLLRAVCVSAVSMFL